MLATRQASFARLPESAHARRRVVGPARRHGLDHDTCGAFLDKYVAVHRTIASRREAPKRAVSLGAEVGLADRLVGTLSVFFYAMLSGRVFQIATYKGLVGLHEAFLPASDIDWRREGVDDHVIQNIKSVQGF